MQREFHMTDLAIILLMSLIFSIYIVGLYIDKKYNFRVVDWLNGECSTPFITTNTAQQVAPEKAGKHQEIYLLQERIQVLEKIVTEPAYELNKKLNALK
jgi:hypothetical protein